MTQELSVNTASDRAEAVRSAETVASQTGAKDAAASRAVEARRKQIVEEIAKSQGLEKGRLVIEKDSASGRFIHKLVDPSSGEIVRQWPEEEWLSFARDFGDTAGLWLDRRV